MSAFRLILLIIMLNLLSISLFADNFTLHYIYTTIKYPYIYKKLLRDRYWSIPTMLITGLLILFLGHILILFYVALTFWKYDGSLPSQLIFLIKHPLMNPEIRGLAYHVPLAIKLNANQVDKIPDFQNKLFWKKYFCNMRVYSPKVYGIIKNGKLILDEDIKDNKTIIIKRIQDTGGSNIQLLNYGNLPNDATYIVQEYIASYKHIAENIRITTLLCNRSYKAFAWNILLTINNNPNDIKTNCNTLYKNYEIIGSFKRMVNSSIYNMHGYDVDMIRLAKDTAIYLHNNLPLFICCIGWDVILTTNGPCFLEGNIVPGLLRRNDVKYYSKIKEYIMHVKMLS